LPIVIYSIAVCFEEMLLSSP